MYGRGVDAVDAIVLVGPAVRVAKDAQAAQVFLGRARLLLLHGRHVADATDEPAEAAHDAGERGLEGGLEVGSRGGGGSRVA